MKKLTYLLSLVLLTGFLFYCQSNKSPRLKTTVFSNNPSDKTAATNIDLNSSPVISPTASLAKMQVEEGFEVKLVAAEPLVNAPVAVTFDNQNRLWVVEMQGYMSDTLGTGEDIPAGNIVLLTDKNKDGVMDSRQVFLDSLLLPRAICLIEDGILVAEPPRLWYYEIKNDKPGKRVLVDAEYAVGGNVEHQPNGLLRAMDNWIYNAKSSKRYRKRGNNWEIEQTHFRGQWGISQDNYGRLYYNTNTENLLGDYLSPGLGATNKNQRSVAGFIEKVVVNNEVFPIRPTPGVNRGYMDDILDKNLRLVNFTAACSPLVYRGALFGKAYEWNVFVAEPSANLIKRNVLHNQGYEVKGEQAYEGKEFLASTDERFRPVSLYNAPDGALYVVDMYRGIIQHKTYLTSYLKKEIGRRKLTQPLTYGRIYKVVPKNKKTKAISLPDEVNKLVKLLENPNGWVRDNAQQQLIDGKHTEAIPALRQALTKTKEPLLVMHALWTLEGLGALKPEEVVNLLKLPVWPLGMQALSVLPAVLNSKTFPQLQPVLTQLIDHDPLAAPYIAYACHYIKSFDGVAAQKLMQQLIKKYPDNKFVADAILSNQQGREAAFLNELTAVLPQSGLVIHKQAQTILTDIRNAEANRNPKVLLKEYPKGVALFNTICQTCHGADGNGVKALAPPLNQSEWVTGDKDRLIAIVLFGLNGPVSVNGHLYKAPEINGDMPGIGYSPAFTNESIAELLSYIRKSWRNNAENVSAEEVAKVRSKYKKRQKAFTVTELDKI